MPSNPIRNSRIHKGDFFLICDTNFLNYQLFKLLPQSPKFQYIIKSLILMSRIRMNKKNLVDVEEFFIPTSCLKKNRSITERYCVCVRNTYV